MVIKLLVLFFAPLVSGLLIFLVPKTKDTNFKLLLVFAGSYLFAITVIHILPELYRQNLGIELIGLFVLAGFFLQQLLEYFTSGVEHGHIHKHDRHGHDHHPIPAAGQFRRWYFYSRCASMHFWKVVCWQNQLPWDPSTT
jgi:hypothetical protein